MSGTYLVTQSLQATSSSAALGLQTARNGVGTVAAVLFLLFGSSGSGKTAALDELRGRAPGLAIHDFDEVGVPSGADTAWRHRSNEIWVRRALEYEARATDLVLAAQTPLGELLATPSATRLEAISACLLDCDDATRLARLESQADRRPLSARERQDYLNWAGWMRRHAADPTWRQDVIRHDATEDEMRWERWSDWPLGDPRWRVRVLDTSHVSKAEVAAELRAWISEERTLFDAGGHPLSKWGDPTRPV